MKTVYREEKTFIPVKETDVYDLSIEMIKTIQQERPELVELRWNLEVRRYNCGLVGINIRVVDLDAPDPRENIKVAFWIALVCAFIILGLTFD